MAIIYSYPQGTPTLSDNVIGSQIDPITEENKTVQFTVGQIAGFANSYSLGYTVYTALITQTGTAAPVATILQNTTGGAIAWTRTATGRYLATISTATYTANKTAVLVTPGGSGNKILKPEDITTTTIEFYNINTQNGNESDVIEATTTVEIRIYA